MGTGYFPMPDSEHFNAYCHDMAVADKSQKMVFAEDLTEEFSSDYRFYDVLKQNQHRFVVYGGPDQY